MLSNAEVFLVLLCFHIRQGKGTKQCYNLAGTAIEFLPCRPNDEVSPCCAVKEPLTASDTCLEPMGWCLSPEGSIWQSGCTDKEGKDNSCPHGCPDGLTNFTQPPAASDGIWSPGMPMSSWSIQLCSNGQMCCRADYHMDCCGNKTLLINSSDALNFSILYPSTPYTFTLNQTSSDNPASTNANQTSQSLTPTASSSSNAGLQCPAPVHNLDKWLGKKVGIPLGIAFVAALVTALIFWRQKRGLEKELMSVQNLNAKIEGAVKKGIVQQAASRSLVELDENHAFKEMP